MSNNPCNGTDDFGAIPNDPPSKPHLEPIPVRDRKRLMTISVPLGLFKAIGVGAAITGKSRSRFACEILLAGIGVAINSKLAKESE
jgi:hypothetical protein